MKVGNMFTKISKICAGKHRLKMVFCLLQQSLSITKVSLKITTTPETTVNDYSQGDIAFGALF